MQPEEYKAYEPLECLQDLARETSFSTEQQMQLEEQKPCELLECLQDLAKDTSVSTKQ